MSNYIRFSFEKLAKKIIDRIENEPDLTLKSLQHDLMNELAEHKAQIEGSIDGSLSWSKG